MPFEGELKGHCWKKCVTNDRQHRAFEHTGLQQQ